MLARGKPDRPNPKVIIDILAPTRHALTQTYLSCVIKPRRGVRAVIHLNIKIAICLHAVRTAKQADKTTSTRWFWSLDLWIYTTLF